MATVKQVNAPLRTMANEMRRELARAGVRLGVEEDPFHTLTVRFAGRLATLTPLDDGGWQVTLSRDGLPPVCRILTEDEAHGVVIAMRRPITPKGA